MKRFLALFLTIIMLLSIVACSQPQNTDPQETTAESTTSQGTTSEPDGTSSEPDGTSSEPAVTDPGDIEPEEPIPDFDNPAEPTEKTADAIVESLHPTQSFDATFDCKEAIIKDVTAIYDTLNAFWKEGYTRLAVDEVEGAKFDIYLLTKGDELVTVYWLSKSNEVRIVWEKADAAALSALQKNASTGKGFLTMAQIGVERGEAIDNPMIGMCYIFKLENGNAIVIDGGYYYDECAENLYKSLVKMEIAQNTDEQYIIEAWIFTHAHGDHNGILNNFVPLYGDKVEVKNFLYQFPTNGEVSVDVGLVGAAGEAAFHQMCKEAFPNATYINPHTGLNYYFDNATISMLYTPDTMWDKDAPIDYYNNNSLIFKVSGGETAFLCLGDAGNKAAARSWSMFNATAYKSGIFQLSHHGMSTGVGAEAWIWDSLENIYKASGAKLVALPLGTRISNDMINSGNGRWSILFAYPYNNDNQMSFIVARGDAPTANGYFAQELLSRFTATVETGHNYIAESSAYATFANIKSLHGYNGINMIDNGHGLITYIASSDQTEMVTVFHFAKGKVTVKANTKLDDWLAIPEFDATDVIEKLDANAQIFESTFGTQEVVLKNVDDKATVVDQLLAHGFKAITVTPVEGATFETLLFTNGIELVTVYWKPTQKEVRILFEKPDENILSLLAPNESTGTGELTMIQVGVERGPGDTGNPMIGMCYVIKLADGRAIIIDGGFVYENNADNVFGALSKLDIARNENGQYIIAAWFFSHGDGDHIGIMESFGKKYSEKADVEYIIYNLPSANSLLTPTSAKGETAFYNNCKAAYPNAIHLIPRAGVKYYFGNATIDMLYTPDFVWSPESKITYYNSTSLVYKVNGGDVSFLSTGDAGESAFKVMWENYDSSTFACDIFQVPHHGLTTQNTEDGTGNYAAHGWTYIKKVYDATGAKYAVLPMGDRNPYDSRNGRATVIVFWGSANCVISYFMNKDDKALGIMSAENYQAFVDSVAAGTNTHQTYLGYNGINILDNGKGLITYIASSELDPMATVFSFADGEIVVETNDKLHNWLAEPTFKDSFESTFDSNMEIWTNVWDITVFTDPLLAEGYTRLDVDTIEGARFETIMLSKGTDLVVMYWHKETGDLRIAYEKAAEGATAPLAPNEETGTGELLVVQIGVDIPDPDNLESSENNPNIGLCYIIKLSNGRAMIIDGGFAYASNADNLFFALESLDIAKDENGRFIIEAWFFTHGHGDHTGITTPFFSQYRHATTINYFVYQMPSNPEICPTGAGVAGEAAFHELCKTAYPEAKYINPHAGVTYHFGNASVDMLHTPDMIWSNSYYIPDYNDSGIIFKTYGGGCEGLLSFGDSGEVPSTAVVKNYDISAVNSNALQIIHHGLNTEVNEGHGWKNVKKLYEGATVQYAFLPMGIAKPNIRSGRWSVLCAWGYTGKQASFVINPEDDAAGVSQANWNAFVSGILNGSLEGETFLGYNGYNVIDNGRGVTTYIHSSETAVMITIMSFKNGEATIEFNDELRFWFSLPH